MVVLSLSPDSFLYFYRAWYLLRKSPKLSKSLQIPQP
jgi:hypothetical protein